ncbi:hypothetical protein JCM5353_002041 [Sporobolomyces roseus]
MILPTALALSLLTLTRALPLTSYSPSQLDLDVSSGSWRYPSFLPSLSDIQQDTPIIKRSIELSLGDEGIVVLDTSASSSSDDGSLQEGSSFADNTSDEEEEAVFNPDDYSEGKAVVRNPKAILNPKNPNYSASLAALRPTTSMTTTSAPTQTPTQAPMTTTFKGEATYFFQNGVAGACGKVNPDSAYIVALDYRLYGDMGKQSKYCGKSLTIKNTSNGKTVAATVADACPTCSSAGSLDLSEAAFGAIGEYDTGILPITWWWN